MNFSWPVKPKASFGALISRLFVLVSCVCVKGGCSKSMLFVLYQWPTILFPLVPCTPALKMISYCVFYHIFRCALTVSSQSYVFVLYCKIICITFCKRRQDKMIGSGFSLPVLLQFIKYLVVMYCSLLQAETGCL